MSRLLPIISISVLVLAVLSCGLISNPISDAKNIASTAEAVATSMPIQTLEALPSAMPAMGQYLNPTGAPVSAWNNIPVMPQASAGQEFNKNTYSFKVGGVTEQDIETFYNDKLKATGWNSQFSMQGGSSGGVMMFSKDTNVLSITITQSDTDFVVLLLLQ